MYILRVCCDGILDFCFLQVSKGDNLPKKICDGCLYKLELLYQFWNTTANAEKQLLTWLGQAGLEATKKTTDAAMAVVTTSKDDVGNGLVVLKQEALDPSEIRTEAAISTDAQTYILQQQQLPYKPFEYGQSSFDDAGQVTYMFQNCPSNNVSLYCHGSVG